MAKTTPAKGSLPEWAPVNLLDVLTDGVSIQDRQMRVIYANKVQRRAFGEDLVGRHCYQVYERQKDVCGGCPVLEVFQTGKSASALRSGIRQDGQTWYADIVVSPLRDHSGEIVAAVEIVRNATERKLFEQEIDRRNRETAALAGVSMALNQSAELEEVLNIALERSIDVCGAEDGMIRLLDEETGMLTSIATKSLIRDSFPADLLKPQPLGVGLTGRAAKEAKIIVVNNLQTGDSEYDYPQGRALLALGARSAAVLPLYTRDKLVGTLAVASRYPGKFNEVDKGLLAAIASQISVSIRNAQLLEEVRLARRREQAYSKGLEEQIEVKSDALAESKQKLHTLIRYANIPILVFDRSASIVEANQAAIEILGCRERELLSGLVNEMACCPDLGVMLSEVFAGRSVINFEHEITDANNRRLFVCTNAAPIIAADGQAKGAIVTMVDISPRKHLEERLAQEKAEFEHTLNNVPIGIHLYDSRRRLIYGNDAFFTMTGSREFLGKTVVQIFGARPSTPAGAKIKKNILSCLRGMPIAEDFFYKEKKIWMYVRYLPIMRYGERHALIITEDVTEKKLLQDQLAKYAELLEKRVAKRTAQLQASETRYRRRNLELQTLNSVAMMVNTSPDARKILRRLLTAVVGSVGATAGLVALENANGRLSLTNYRNLAAAEAKAAVERIEKSPEMRSLTKPANVGRCQAGYVVAAVPLRSKEVNHGFILLGRKEREFSGSEMSLLAALGGEIGIALENHRLLEEAGEKNRILSEAYGDLKELDQLKSEFVSVVSHELRTPLATIRGYVEIVKDGLLGPINPEQKSKLLKAEKRVDRLTELVNDLLDLSALEKRKFRIVRRKYSAADIIGVAVSEVVASAQEKKQRLAVDIEPENLQIYVDKKSFVRVLDNLLENACKFSPEGGKITISAAKIGLDTFIKISDKGPGIDKKTAAKIFERFFVGQTQSDRTHGGTGLGLAIVKAIVEAHDGEIWVESRPGAGAVFVIKLARMK